MQQFIQFIWPLMAYILKWALCLALLYAVLSYWASDRETQNTIAWRIMSTFLSIVTFPLWGINYRNVLRYLLFVLLFPLMLVVGFIARLITHPSDRP